MAISGTWFSPEGYTLNLLSNAHFLSGHLVLAEPQVSNFHNLNGVLYEYKNYYDFAFIINWKLPAFNSVTAFTGRKTKKDNKIDELSFNWFLSTENLLDNMKSSYSGSGTLFKIKPALRVLNPEQTTVPYPFELLQFTNSHLFPVERREFNFL